MKLHSRKLHTATAASATSALILALAFSMNARAVDIVAHGGASDDAPYDTLASERLAWEQKADVVANNIRQTADGRIIVSHDSNVKRVTGVDLVVENTTFDELRKLDAGARKNPRFAGEKLPSLDEQLALIRPGKRMFVEIKAGPDIVPELARCLERNKAGGHNVTFISFDYETLKAVREKMPGVPLLYIVGFKKPAEDKTAAKAKSKTAATAKKGTSAKDEMNANTNTKDEAAAVAAAESTATPAKIKPWTYPASKPTLDEAIARAKAARLTGLDLQNTWPLGEAEVRKIKDAGLELHVWTINTPEEARRWIALGVASITTDRPGWLRAELGL